MTPFGLCADDYGISAAVGIAIRNLAAAGRISATSGLVTLPAWPAEAAALAPLSGRIEVGLHLNLTLGAPLAPMPRLAPGGLLPTLPRLIGRSLAGRLDQAEVAAEIDRQIDRFIADVGRPPAFIDGHEHVQQMPGIRGALLAVCRRRFPPGSLWLRASAMTMADLACHPPAALPRALAIALLGAGWPGRSFAASAAAAGFPSNRGFRGVRRFRSERPYPRLFEAFVRGIAAGGLVMCHPGLAEDGGGSAAISDARHPDAARDEEYRFLMSDALPRLLAGRRLRLAPLGPLLGCRG